MYISIKMVLTILPLININNIVFLIIQRLIYLTTGESKEKHFKNRGMFINLCMFLNYILPNLKSMNLVFKNILLVKIIHIFIFIFYKLFMFINN